MTTLKQSDVSIEQIRADLVGEVIAPDDADSHVVRRTTTSAVRNIKSRPPRTASIS